MLSSVYRSSVKSLLRSKAFWLMAFTLFFMQIFKGMQTHFAYVDLQSLVTIRDFDADFVYETKHFLKLCDMHIVFNQLAIFTTAISVFALKRDFEDKFYEIEKSCGLPVWRYCIGRITAVITVIVVTTYALNFTYLIAYCIKSGRLPVDMTLWDCVSTAIVNVTKNILSDIGTIVFFVTLTYMIAYLTSMPVYGSIGVILYIIIYDIVLIRTRLTSMAVFEAMNYVPPRARALSLFREGLDTFGAQFYGITMAKVWMAIGVLIGSYLLFYFVTWLRARRRID